MKLKALFKKYKKTPLYGRTIFVLFIISLIIKQFVIIQTYGNIILGENILITLFNYLPYLLSDFIVFIIMLLLILINFTVKNKKIRIVPNILLIGILFIFTLDIFSIYFFQSRISILDVKQFTNSIVLNFVGFILKYTILLTITGIISFILLNINKNKLNYKILITIILSLLLPLYILTITQKTYNIKKIDNVFSINIKSFNKKKQNSSNDIKIIEIKEDLDKVLVNENFYEDYFIEIVGDGKSPNIILIFAESLSAIDSLKIGGLNNNTPNFDLIQKDGITFNNFISNGTTSDSAHIATLQGTESLKNNQNKSMYFGYETYLDTLPMFLKKQGYHTKFISTVSLKFFNQIDFLSGIGFDEILGEQEFINKKRFTLNAASDGDLYEKTLEEIKKQKSPFFIGIQTISFHKPYNTPYGNTEKDAIKYSDEKLYEFYKNLKKSGFFENGILIIIGDHRKMEPIEKNEKEIFGEVSYLSKSMATIVGDGVEENFINNSIIQHTDFFYSIKKLTGKGKIKINKLYNDVFKNEENRNRGITDSRYFNTLYTLSFDDNSYYQFNNISQIKEKYPKIYDYFLSYIKYQNGARITTNKENNNIKIIGHRGTPNINTENSLKGFLDAYKLGSDGIELDISYTKDKKNIVMHGEYPYSTNCRTKYKIRNQDLSRLKNNCILQNKEEILTLEEMLKLIDGLFQYYFIEIKVYNENDAKQQTLDAINTIRKLKMEDRVIFISYNETSKYILGSQKDIISGRDTFDINDINKISNTTHKYVLMPYNQLNKEIVDKIKNMNKEIVTYTINNTGDLKEAINMGINIIMTDDIALTKNNIKNN